MSEGGIWWGNPLYGVLPDWQMAMRDDDYKLVRQQTTDYSTTSNSCVSTQYTEFYQINQDTGLNLKLDNPERNLYPDQLNKDAKKEFDKLSKELDKLLDSQVACPGDGNLDGVVDQKDIEQLTYWANVTDRYSSWYDFNLDGRTNLHDLRRYVIDGKFPRKCPQ
jgi:hypothetical protein